MKKNQRIIAGIAAIVVGLGIIVAAVLVGNNRNNGDPLREDIGKTCPISEIEGIETVSYSGIEGETALATLKDLCDVESQGSDYGDFVTGIDGVDADTEHYWAFYVNDAYATEGAGTYKTKDGDSIKWELTSLDASY
ncbi:MAG: DUF4430 domain-containing protein [Candidatus Nomurabacteria bacterium]|jgi:hypothetical protein|nr:DUF4430 domain-containing protein [Candidatus Nomurabacteria bacterium]